MEFMSIAIDRIVYLSLLGLGMYFIYEGVVVYRYRLRKTNFAEKSEQVTLWCQLEEPVLLIGTLLLFSPIFSPKCKV